MTALLENRQQIAAPKRALPLTPLALRAFAPVEADSNDGLKNIDGSLDAARKLAEEHSESAIAWARLAQAELASGNPDRVRQAALRAIEKSSGDSHSESVLVAAIIALIASGNEVDAERSLHELDNVGKLPATILATLEIKRGDTRSALRRLEALDTSESWFLRGVIANQESRFGEAIHAYRSAIRLAGPSPATLTNLGVAYASSGQLDKAIASTRQALSMKPSQDSCVTFNLAWYFTTAGDLDSALDTIRNLRHSHPDEIQPIFAEVGIRLMRNEQKDAHRVLRKARTQLWPSLDPLDQAALEANLAFVRWHMKERTREQAADEITRALASVDYANTQVAEMLTVLRYRFSEAAETKKIYARVREQSPGETLFALDVHQAVLEHRFEDASRISQLWAKKCVLDPEAATTAIFLLADVEHDYERAARIGLDALSRMPAANRLRNNVAYALALGGRVAEAANHRPVLDSPQHYATNALIALRLGEEAAARELYAEAFKRGMKSDVELGVLVKLNALLAVHRFGSESMKEWVDNWAIGIDLEEWTDSPQVALATRSLNEFKVSVPT